MVLMPEFCLRLDFALPEMDRASDGVAAARSDFLRKSLRAARPMIWLSLVTCAFPPSADASPGVQPKLLALAREVGTLGR